MTHNNYPITPPLAPAETSTLPDWVTNPPILLIIATATVALAVLITAAALTARLVRRIHRPAEDMLTLGVAALATGVSAQGMWRFFEDKLGIDGPLRIMLFAFIELAVAASAIRARRNMRDTGSAGIDGIAVWALAGLTATLSAMDARSTAEALFRLAAPLVAAWLWERGMAVERRRLTGRKRINWRITPERILVRLGLAEATERTVGEVDTQRRLTRVALAAERLRYLRAAGAAGWRVRLAAIRLRRLYTLAALHTGIARSLELQSALESEVAGLLAAEQLADVAPAAVWSRPADDQSRPVGDQPTTGDHDATTPTTTTAAASATGTRDHDQDATEPDQPRPTIVHRGPGHGHGRVRWADLVDSVPENRERPLPTEEEHNAVASAFDYLKKHGTLPTPGQLAAETGHPEGYCRAPATAPAATTETATSAAAGDGDQPDDQTQPDETKSESEFAIEIIREYCKRARSLPSKRRLAGQLGRRETWWLKQIQEARRQLEAEGWKFTENGTAIPPLAMNGARPDQA